MSFDPFEPESQASFLESIRDKALEAVEGVKDKSIDFIMGEESIVEDIPILKTIRAGGKAVGAVRDYLLTRKLMAFLAQMNAGGALDAKMQAFKDQCAQDEGFRDRVISQLIIYLDRVDSERKAKIIANLFLGFVEGKFTLERLNTLLRAAEMLSDEGIDFLRANDPGRPYPHSVDTRNDLEALLHGSGLVYRYGTGLVYTALAGEMLEIGLVGV